MSDQKYWYVVLPWWVIQKGGGWDEFCAKYEESHERTGIYLIGVIGFETSYTWPKTRLDRFWNGTEVYRYTVKPCAHLAHRDGMMSMQGTRTRV